jgi:hypothetical protein
MRDGWPLQLLTAIDNSAEARLAIRAAGRLTAEAVHERLTELFCSWAVPEYILSDMGPWFASDRIRRWLGELSTYSQFLGPGSPWDKGLTREFNGWPRGKLLTRAIFYNLAESQVLVQRWRLKYNQRCPHSSLWSASPAPKANCLPSWGPRPTPVAAFGLPWNRVQKTGADQEGRSGTQIVWFVRGTTGRRNTGSSRWKTRVPPVLRLR